MHANFTAPLVALRMPKGRGCEQAGNHIRHRRLSAGFIGNVKYCSILLMFGSDKRLHPTTAVTRTVFRSLSFTPTLHEIL